MDWETQIADFSQFLFIDFLPQAGKPYQPLLPKKCKELRWEFRSANTVLDDIYRFWVEKSNKETKASLRITDAEIEEIFYVLAIYLQRYFTKADQQTPAAEQAGDVLIICHRFVMDFVYDKFYSPNKFADRFKFDAESLASAKFTFFEVLLQHDRHFWVNPKDILAIKTQFNAFKAKQLELENFLRKAQSRYCPQDIGDADFIALWQSMPASILRCSLVDIAKYVVYAPEEFKHGIYFALCKQGHITQATELPDCFTHSAKLEESYGDIYAGGDTEFERARRVLLNFCYPGTQYLGDKGRMLRQFFFANDDRHPARYVPIINNLPEAGQVEDLLRHVLTHCKDLCARPKDCSLRQRVMFLLGKQGLAIRKTGDQFDIVTSLPTGSTKTQAAPSPGRKPN